VVRREVEEDSDPRSKLLDVLELEARELADDPGVLGKRAVEARQRAADVPRHGHRRSGRAKHRAEELARGRLPVRSGDAEDRVGEETRAELDLAPDGQPTLARGGRERGLRWNTRAFDEQVHAVEKLGVVRAEDDFDTRGTKPARVEIVVPVDAEDRDSPAGERERSRLARAGEAENERFLRRPAN
jgi:hypothetical protein